MEIIKQLIREGISIITFLVIFTISLTIVLRAYRKLEEKASKSKSKKKKKSQNELKGIVGEKEVINELSKLDTKIFKVVNDVYIPKGSSGKTSQCDHIVISKFGVFVIETKNYSGRVVGNEIDEKLTQILGSKQFEFYNPIHQNKKHVETLSNFLHIKKSDCISIVNFCNKTDITGIKSTSKVVNTNSLLKSIKVYRKERFSSSEVKAMYNKLNNLPKNSKVVEKHKKYVKDLYSNK